MSVAQATYGRVLVVLPTYDEARTIERVIESVRRALPSAHVLVVDDASPDGTAEIARALGRRVGEVSVLERPAKAGLGTAYRDGFTWGLERGYEILCEMDSDLSHDPADLPRLVAAVSSGRAELVIGSRYVPGGKIRDWSVVRRVISRVGNLYADAMLGLGVADATAGFRAYSASLLARIGLENVRANYYGFQVEMTYLARRAGGSILELPVCFTDRKGGTSKLSGHTVSEAFVLVGLLGLRRLWHRSARLDDLEAWSAAPVRSSVDSRGAL
jgi:dolichol-phosphate mannosyltransferase